MRKFGLLGTSALRSAAFIGLSVGLASPALAQTGPENEDETQLEGEVEIESGEDADPDTPGATDDTITITGSRIRRPNLESTVPITSIGGDEFFDTGRQAIGDVLNDLPSLRSTLGSQNFNLNLGVAGLNLLDLRGLGFARTLVLQNGRRHVGGDVLSTGISTDINTIPADLIERVDIVTGGNSAIYGSDAIAGVVNFVLKRNFDGIQVRGSSGVSGYGDNGTYTASITAGTNFAGGRGNVVVNAQYSHQSDYYLSDRPWAARARVFVAVDTDPAGTPNGSDGIPDAQLLEDVRSATTSLGGLIAFPAAAGSTFTRPYLFLPDGTLVPQTGTRVGIAPNGNFLGGNGITGREFNQTAFSPDLDRYAINLLGHFTISDALEPFIEAKYARLDTSSVIGSAAFLPAFGVARERVSINNPFLSPQARATILSIAGPATTSFAYRGRLNDLGPRIEDATRETYRVVAGVRGTFNDDWSYEAALNYGEMREKNAVLGNLNMQRLFFALDVVDGDPGPGVNPVCRVSIDPKARVPFEFADPDVANAQLANDVAQCAPANFFGTGNLSAAARDYLLSDTFAEGRTSQFVANAFISGDTSEFFNLWGGPIGFAIGAEYRKQDLYYNQDPLVNSGLTFYNAIPTFEAPQFEVKEAFGEVRIPILADMPFFHEFTVSAAGRVADYKLGAGTVYAWNAGAEWAPVPDIRFRGNFSRAVRAPSQGELFTGQFQNFAPGFQDPCAERNIGAGTSTRAANCAAAGRPTGYDYVYLSSLQITGGGNPDLQEESSDSLTLGVVFQPRWARGLSISADYYDITVNNVISTPTAQGIVNNCYDSPDLNNRFCELFDRFSGPGEGPAGEIPFRILEGSLLATSLNFAKLVARGVDTEISYRREIEPLGTLSTRFIYTRVLERTNYTNLANPDFGNRILTELGDPRDAFNWNIDLKKGPFTLGYQMRYIGKMVTSTYEAFFPFQGRPASNLDAFDRKFYPAVTYHNARIETDVDNRFNFYIGIDNLTNRRPPLDATGVGAGSGIYDARGRFFYAGAVAKF